MGLTGYIHVSFILLSPTYHQSLSLTLPVTILTPQPTNTMKVLLMSVLVAATMAEPELKDSAFFDSDSFCFCVFFSSSFFFSPTSSFFPTSSPSSSPAKYFCHLSILFCLSSSVSLTSYLVFPSQHSAVIFLPLRSRSCIAEMQPSECSASAKMTQTTPSGFRSWTITFFTSPNCAHSVPM